MAFYGATEDTKWWQLKKKIQARKAGEEAAAYAPPLPAEGSVSTESEGLPVWALPAGVAAAALLVGGVLWATSKE